MDHMSRMPWRINRITRHSALFFFLFFFWNYMCTNIQACGHCYLLSGNRPAPASFAPPRRLSRVRSGSLSSSPRRALPPPPKKPSKQFLKKNILFYSYLIAFLCIVEGEQDVGRADTRGTAWDIERVAAVTEWAASATDARGTVSAQARRQHARRGSDNRCICAASAGASAQQQRVRRQQARRCVVSEYAPGVASV